MTQENLAKSENSAVNSTNATADQKSSNPLFLSPLVFGLVLVFAIIGAIFLAPPRDNSRPLAEKPVEGQEAPYRKFIRDAHENIKQGFDREALSDLKRAHKLAPEEVETNAELGVFLCSLQSFRSAEPYLARARQLDPKKAEIASAYATCLAELGQKDMALEEIAHACRLDPNNQKYLFLAGSLCISSYREEQAIVYLSLLLKFAPRHKEALRMIAHAEGLRGEHGRATAALQRLLKLFPYDANAHEAYQQTSLRAGLGEKLVAKYQARYTKDPNMMNARLLAKSLACFPDKIKIARRVLKEALLKSPTNIDLQVEAAGLDYLFGDYKSSIAWLDRVIVSKKSPAKAFLVRALVARAQRDTRTATIMFERTLTTDPIPAHLGMISLMRDGRAYKQALARIQALQKQSPASGKAMLTAIAAEVFGESGKRDKSVDTYSKAVAKGEGRPSVYEGLGKALLIKGRLVEAVRAFTSGLPHKSKDPNLTRGRESLLLWRGVAHALGGDALAAKRDFVTVSQSPKKHLPFAAYIALAQHMLGQIDADKLAATTQFHGKGIFFNNDRLFFVGFALELAGKKKEALKAYEQSRKQTIGDESPARLVDKQMAILNKK
jgi:tetratricopeptide (TPR) repeat protein